MNNKSLLKMYLKDMHLKQEDAAKIWGISRISAWRKLTKPEKITLEELVLLWKNLPEKYSKVDRYALILCAFDAAIESIKQEEAIEAIKRWPN